MPDALSSIKQPQQLTELSPPTITISLEYWLFLAARGYDEYQSHCAVVSAAMGQYIRGVIDTPENHCHVEDIKYELCRIYPIAEWLQSVHRRTKRQEYAEQERQKRFAADETYRLKTIAIERRRDILVTENARLRRTFSTFQPLGMDFTEHLAHTTMLNAAKGIDHPKALKLGFTLEECVEYASLPDDPECKNPFIWAARALEFKQQQAQQTIANATPNKTT